MSLRGLIENRNLCFTDYESLSGRKVGPGGLGSGGDAREPRAWGGTPPLPRGAITVHVGARHQALPGSPVLRQQSTNLDAPGQSRADSAWNSRAASWPGQAAGSSAAGNPGSVNRNLRHSWTSALRSAKTAGSGASGPTAAISSPA